MSVVISVRVRREVLEVVNEMIKYGLASTRNEALNKIIARGLREIEKEVKRRKRVRELVELFKRQGGIRFSTPSDVVRELEELRS